MLNIVLVLIVVGVALYLINGFIPMASGIKTILNIVVVVAVCVWLLEAVGLWGTVRNFRLTRGQGEASCAIRPYLVTRLPITTGSGCGFALKKWS